jgi:hypothetical protein
LVVTNVPYLARGKQHESLKDYCAAHYSEAKADLANVFLERCLELSLEHGGGAVQVVLPQSWLALSKFEGHRKNVLTSSRLKLIVRLGEGAFESPQAAGAFVCMCTVERNTSGTEGIYCALEVSELGGVRQKTKGLLETAVAQLSQCDCIRSSDHEILLSKPNNTTTIGDFARSFHGITTTDLLRFSKLFWESNGWTSKWVFQQGAVDGTREIGGREAVLLWENGAGELKKLQLAGATVVITGLEAWGKQGIAINRVRNLYASRYQGDAFDTSISVLE